MLIQGPAGIGKTALLQEARGFAQRCRVRALVARGGELERDFPFAVVRQLFEPALRDLDEARRRELFRGAAALAAPLMAPDASGTSTTTVAGDPSFAALHGLYWLTANLATWEPVLFVVDDVHWSDSPTLRFLLYLARRLEGLPVTLVFAARPGEPGVERDVLSALAAQPDAKLVRPAALSEQAVARLVGEGLGERPDDAFVTACHAATGGTPFLVRELVATLAADGVRPTAEMAARVGELGPATVAHATLLRVARLPAAATRLAQAVAVLGGDARLHMAARLAELDDAQALEVVDALISVNILRPGQPLEFVHPIVRAAVYEDLPRGQRSAAHARAARVLKAQGADLDVVAVQLLSTEPAGSPAVVKQLRGAAASGRARGAPEVAAVYLRRALEEGVAGRDLHAALLYELGSVEKLLRDPDAVDCLQKARHLEKDPLQRAQIAHDLAEILAFSGRWGPLPELLESALADVQDRDPELALRLESMRAAMATYDPRHVAQLEGRLASLRTAASGQSIAARGLSLLHAAITVSHCGRPREVLALAEHGLDEGRFLAAAGSESWELFQGLMALMFIDELDRAHALAGEMLAVARQTGSLLGFVAGLGHRGLAAARRGDLVSAEADLRASLERAQEHDLHMVVPVSLWYGAEPILERPELADVAAMVETVEIPPALAPTFTGAVVLEVRGRLRSLAGNLAGAVNDLRACGQTIETLRFRNPSLSGWRSALALALAHDEPDAARRLVSAELADARRAGVARGIGVALRATGAIEGGESGLCTLRDAVSTLASSPARLEYARALVELGAALRRANHRAAARDPLREGLDLAHRCGATRLAERARIELAAAGAKPRRLRVTGRDALTPSEQRIARMAADGLRNREIAQALFVTTKTVENHLGHIYGKLAITSREALAEALERERPPA